MHSRTSSILHVLQPTVHNCQVHTMTNHSQGPLSGFDECTIQAYQLIQLIHPTHRSVVLVYNFTTVPRQFVYTHFVYDTSSTDISSIYRHFVYYCIPAYRTVIHPTSVSANYYFHQ